ncbi:MAG: hypothetical protein IRY89_01500 [Pseudolabrys sp.]|nr:hypothetical protein [Pseudolabrys sp.]
MKGAEGGGIIGKRNLRPSRAAGKAIREEGMAKGIVLWLIGIPIPIIILLWIFGFLH